jgi:hypothetical protein
MIFAVQTLRFNVPLILSGSVGIEALSALVGRTLHTLLYSYASVRDVVI